MRFGSNSNEEVLHAVKGSPSDTELKINAFFTVEKTSGYLTDLLISGRFFKNKIRVLFAINANIHHNNFNFSNVNIFSESI